MVGGVRFEHTHRMIAEFVGLLTIVLAIWTWRVEKRRWMKALALAALGTVIAQGVLGGLTVLFYLPPAISSAHAALAQTFFCIAVAIAVFTGRRWVEEVPQVELDWRRPSLITLSLLSIFVLLRSADPGRHVSPSRHELVAACGECRQWWPWCSLGLRCARSRSIRRSKRCGGRRLHCWGLLITQLCLGFVAFLTRVAWGRDAVQPELPMVMSTVAHVAVGALLLATAVVLAIQVWRHVPVSFAERVPAGAKPAAA